MRSVSKLKVSLILLMTGVFLTLVKCQSEQKFKIAPNTIKVQPEDATNLLKMLIQNDFQNCDIFHAFNGNGQNSQKVRTESDRMMRLTLSWVLDSNWMISNGVYQFDLSSIPLEFKLSPVHHKKSSQCALVLIDLLKSSVEDPENLVDTFKVSSQLTDLLTTTYETLTKKDQDHYIIHSDAANYEKFLFEEFTKDLKFKIVLFETETRFHTKMSKTLQNVETPREINLVSVCFYCNEGLPLIVDVGPAAHAVLGQVKTQSEIEGKSILNLKNLLFQDFTRNAQGYEIRVSAQTRLVFVYSIEYRENEDRWYFRRGFGKSIIEGITSRFNYTYRVFPAIGNGGSGAILANGTWVGSVRDIIDGRTHIGLAVALNYARYKLIGGNSFFYAWVNFIMGRPKHVYSWKTIFWPLSKTLWLWTVIALSLVIITFKMLHWRERYYSNHELNTAQMLGLAYHGHGHRHPQNFVAPFDKHAGTYLTFSLVEQSVVYPLETRSRILCCIWLVSVIIITTAYKSKLVTLMTFPTLQTLPKTFSDLVRSDFNWGLESAAIGGAAHQHFRTSSNPVNRKIFDKMSLERNSRKCFTQGIVKNFACITWSTQGEYVLHRNFTTKNNMNPLVMSEDLSAIVGSGIAYKKRALFSLNFDRVVDSIREMGMAEKWKLMDFENERQDHLAWLKRSNQFGTDSLTGDQTDDDVLTMDNLRGTFYLLFAGLASASFAWLAEVLQKLYAKLTRTENENGTISQLRKLFNDLRIVWNDLVSIFVVSRSVEMSPSKSASKSMRLGLNEQDRPATTMNPAFNSQFVYSVMATKTTI